MFKKASKQDVANIKSYKILRKLNFIEFPKLGLNELEKIKKKNTTVRRLFTVN